MANISNISDELLAAYLDGNTTEAETRQVLEALHNDPALREAVSIAMRADIMPIDVLPMMRMAAESGENMCSVMCEAFVLNRRGIAYDEAAMVATAREHQWLRAEGSPLHAMGQLLACQGLMVTHEYDATITDMCNALDNDNDVIVAVDSGKLYPDAAEEKNIANHAVVVTAVDTEGKKVTIYDPGRGDIQTVETDDFIQAWDTSCNYLVRVLQEVGEYDPKPINLGDIDLNDDLLELREAIAENAHNVWAAARIKEGWRYGSERDDANKRHPDLVPYCALPDAEKEYDRLMALDTIKLVKKLGFNITLR